MKDIIQIDIIIPTMNRRVGLERTLNGISKSKVYPARIIIVDQTINLYERKKNKNMIINNFSNLNIEYIELDTPSLTKARNIGMCYSKSDIIICMDDDVDIEEDTILNVFNIMSDNNISMIAGMDSNYLSSKFSFSSLLGYIFYKKSFFKRKYGHVTHSTFGRFPRQFKGTIETEWAMGFFFVIRKSLLMKWNLKWDENLKSYAYGEDLDFSYQYYLKSKNEQYRCVMDSSVIVTHLATKEWRISNKNELFMLAINRLYINYKLFDSVFSRIAYNWTNIGLIFEKIILKDNYKEFIQMWKIANKYRKEIKKGSIPYKLLE